MALFLSIYLFSVIGFLIHLFTLDKAERTRARVIELLLLYQLVFNVGITSFFAFIGFSLMPEYVATYIDWTACQFEQEMANVNLAFSVLGILCIWLRGNFWTATVLGFSIWIFTDGIHHLYEMFDKHNYAPGNVGVPLVTDLVIPTILMILLAFYLRERKI